MLRNQTPPKGWFGNANKMSYRDVTNRANQIEMTTYEPSVNAPLRKVTVRHWATLQNFQR